MTRLTSSAKLPPNKVREATEILIQIQQARFDKQNHGQGLSIQELAELEAINELFKSAPEMERKN